jgi:hypothetical protein
MRNLNPMKPAPAADLLFEAHNSINQIISTAAFQIIEGADPELTYQRVTRDIFKALADATEEMKGTL